MIELEQVRQLLGVPLVLLQPVEQVELAVDEVLVAAGRCSSSVFRQKMMTPTQPARTATPWISDQVHGRCWPATWSKMRPGMSQEPTPWLRIVKSTFQTNGTQSWYSAMKPIMTKKWKCASMEPPESTTSAAEQ